MWHGKKVSVVLSSYRERESVRAVIEGYFATGVVDEVIAVDNNAEPGSNEEIRKTRAKLITEKRQGQGWGLRAGMREARGEYVAFTDADLPYGLEVLSLMLGVMHNDGTLFFLYGSRSHHLSQEKKGYGTLRRLGRMFFSLIIRMVVVPGVSDTQCGLKMFKKELAECIARRAVVDRFALDVECFVIADANHWKYQDFPVELNHRKESSVRLVRDTILMCRDVLTITLNSLLGRYERARSIRE